MHPTRAPTNLAAAAAPFPTPAFPKAIDGVGVAGADPLPLTGAPELDPEEVVGLVDGVCCAPVLEDTTGVTTGVTTSEELVDVDMPWPEM
jgi:hypothetical protein